MERFFTCADYAQVRLENRPIKTSTLKEYLHTLRVLGLSDLPYESISISLVNTRLQTVLSAGTRRKHAANVRAALGIKIPIPKQIYKSYDLPTVQELHTALDGCKYEMQGLVMLYAGLRIGESCVNQPLSGRILNVDRQKLPDNTVASSKTAGPVVIPTWLADRYRDHDFTAISNSVYKTIRRTLRREGFKLTPHALRHAFATNLVKCGASPEVLRRQMRHHDVAVSLRYYVHTTDSDIMTVMDSFGSPHG